MKSRLTDVPAAIRLSRAALRNIHENLFWAFIYNIIGIPLAAGAWIPLFGWKLNPMFGAAAMSLSSFCVVTNALRLNLFQLNRSDRDKKLKNAVAAIQLEQQSAKSSDDSGMQVTLHIKGMMCGHCEATVKKCLEAFPEVDEAIVSHTEGTAVVKLNAPADLAALKKAVTEQGYQVKK